MNDNLDINKIEDLLLNIENLEDNDLELLKNNIVFYNYLKISKEYLVIYNKMSVFQFKRLIELVGYNALDIRLIGLIDNFNKLIIPYSLNTSYYYKNVFKNIDYAKEVLNNEIFYESLITNDINIIFNSLPNEDLKKYFVNYLLNNKFSLLFNEMNFNFLNSSVKKYIMSINIDDLLIKNMKISDDLGYIIFLFRFLSKDMQENIFSDNWFNSKIDMNNLDEIRKIQ